MTSRDLILEPHGVICLSQNEHSAPGLPGKSLAPAQNTTVEPCELWSLGTRQLSHESVTQVHPLSLGAERQESSSPDSWWLPQRNTLLSRLQKYLLSSSEISNSQSKATQTLSALEAGQRGCSMASDSSPVNRSLSQMLPRSPLHRYSLEVHPKRAQDVSPFCILGLFTIKSSVEGCV